MNYDKLVLPWVENYTDDGNYNFFNNYIDNRTAAKYIKYNLNDEIVAKIFFKNYLTTLDQPYCAKLCLPLLKVEYPTFNCLSDAKKFIDDYLLNNGYKNITEHMKTLL